MEKRISFLEGFGDLATGGDGFVAASPAVAPGAPSMTACALFRFDTWDLSGTIGRPDKIIAGNITPTGFIPGWAIAIGFNGLYVAALNNSVVYDFTDGDTPVAGRAMVCYLVANVSRLSMYLNGQLVADLDALPPVVPAAADGFVIGAAPSGGFFDPFGESSDVPSARSGIAGVAYGEFAMTDADVAEHYRQILEAEDVIDGGFGWDNLWSVREGIPDLEVAGGDSATWTDEIGGAVLTRTQFNQQAPSMSVGVREARIY